MAVVVGIDEAGFGPLLGPLVVSSIAFELPSEAVDQDLWQLLKRSVARQRKNLAGRLLITDSKKAFKRSAGLEHLERTVLCCLQCLGLQPATLRDLLCPNSLGRLQQYPWYKDAIDMSLSGSVSDRAISAAVLKDDLAAHKMRLLALKSTCLDVGRFNSLVETIRNKAGVLFCASAELIQQAFDAYGDQPLLIVLDRQGGRVRYRALLQRVFHNMTLRILHESPQRSSYDLVLADRSMRVDFVVSADEQFLPVSLASMVSKYLRELMVSAINRYFAALLADLKPTAGYWKDGQRFLRDLQTRLPHLQLDRRLLVRNR